MKELVILRHAKSNRSYAVDDIHRPLSAEGIERITSIAEKKADFFEHTDILLSSPAIRVLHTAMIVVQELYLPFEKLTIDQNLYTFSGSRVIDYVYTLDDRWTKVVLVGHNPAFTEVINHFSEVGINHLRTAGLAKITFDSETWSDVTVGDAIMGQKQNDTF